LAEIIHQTLHCTKPLDMTSVRMPFTDKDGHLTKAF